MESNKLKKIMKQIEDATAAVSFAEEGEFEAAESLLKRERRVLLALGAGHVDPKTLKYALNAAKRINAQLDILFILPSSAQDFAEEPVFRQFQSELEREGLRFTVIHKTGCMKQEIIDYTNKEYDVLFVVVEAPGSLDAECKKKDSRLSELWQKLRCPLVVVSEAGT